MTDYLNVVRRFADNVLARGRDPFRSTPMFCDGLNLDTMRPVEWLCNGERWAICNPHTQQHLFRTFVALSNLTGDPKYRDAARDAMLYFFEHHSDSTGLLKWGGHQFVDLRTGREVGEAPLHEFKCSYPFYEFLFEIAPQRTKRFVEALWNGHVYDWSNLDMTRHGEFDRPMGKLWASDYVGGDVFFYGRGLTFINCGSDLVYAAGLLHAFTRERGPLLWAKRLAHRYVEARDPKTRLGAYQFSQPIPSAGVGKAGTLSSGGDRAKNQFGPEFGERALEGKVLDPYRAGMIYGNATIAQMRIAEKLGDEGREFIDWNHNGLLAYARHAYDAETNTVAAMFTDGTRLAPDDVKRPGYYSRATFEPKQASPMLLLSYALAYRLTRDEELMKTVRAMARAHEQNSSDPIVLFAMLELYQATDDPGYLERAGAIAENIVRDRFRGDFFLPSKNHVNASFNASFNALEPLALLSLEAARAGKRDAVPAYNGGQPFIHGPFDGKGRAKDGPAIWSVTRS